MNNVKKTDNIEKYVVMLLNCSKSFHYSDVIMSTMASQITTVTSVYSFIGFNLLFRRRSKKISKLRVTGLCEGNSPVTGEFPAQMASNAENVSIWWRHHVVASWYFFRCVCRLPSPWSVYMCYTTDTAHSCPSQISLTSCSKGVDKHFNTDVNNMFAQKALIKAFIWHLCWDCSDGLMKELN